MNQSRNKQITKVSIVDLLSNSAAMLLALASLLMLAGCSTKQEHLLDEGIISTFCTRVIIWKST